MIIANYAYDLTGNLAFALGCFAATASLVQMFQIGSMRRQIALLEGRLSSLQSSRDDTGIETSVPSP